MKTPFNKPFITGKEIEYIKDTIDSGRLSGDNKYTKKCQSLMENTFNVKKVLLTTSCTHALDLSAMLLNIKNGDEFIAPSYTFVSTVNAFVLRGAKPVFVDIRPDTLNINEALIESKLTSRTRAIVVVHYAGVGCEMDKILEIGKRHSIPVVEDAAQGVNAKYKGKYLGTIGDIGCYSFHETKNYVCGEGGAILLNDEKYIERAEIIREKGTDRSKFIRGEVDKYTWVDIGSSYLPSDILAAHLYAQLEELEKIQKLRRDAFYYYHENLKNLEDRNLVKMLHSPEECSINYHIFYLILKDQKSRDSLQLYLRSKDLQAVSHYLPLHSSPVGSAYHNKEKLPVTDMVASCITRLPLYAGITRETQDEVIHEIYNWFDQAGSI